MDLDLRSSFEVFSKSKIHLTNLLEVGGEVHSVQEIIQKLEPLVLSERAEKLKKVVGLRSLQVVTVLENIYDRGNVSAVMRTAESLGFFRFHVIEPEGAKFKAANRVTKGAEKWLDVNVTKSAVECVTQLKSAGYVVAGTDLEADFDLSEIPVDRPVALVIGNEKQGISEEMRAAVDVRVKIPMVGFSQSYNLSVATALCLYELSKKMDVSKGMSDEQRQQLYAHYLLRCFDNPAQLLKREILF